MLLGKYRVDDIIGRGGMGLVVKAWHLLLDEQVAIKMLRDDIALADETVARFVREAQAAVKLKSEHIARITDVGTFDDGKPYMVMEYLEGQDIGDLLVERTKLQPSLAIDLVIQACEGLAEAHSLGIVHRDIKPTNLFLTSRPDGTVLLKILDFGISKAPSGPELFLTQTWSVLGTPAYMSPEQMRSARDVDARTDVWSLGAVLYEALEGHVPFEADSFSEMCVLVAVDPFAPMTATPRELVPIISRCLTKNADDRYPNVAELARDLAKLAREPERALVLVDRMVRMLGRGTTRTPAVGMPVLGPDGATSGAELRAMPADEPVHRTTASVGVLRTTNPPLAHGSGSAIGVPLGPVSLPAIVVPPRPPSAPSLAALPRPVPGLGSSPAIDVPPDPTAVPPSYPSVPTYQTRVPLPVPLHDDALFPRPGLQLPRGAQIAAALRVAPPRRGWMIAAATAIVALAAVVAVVAATRASQVPAQPDDGAPVVRTRPIVTPISVPAVAGSDDGDRMPTPPMPATKPVEPAAASPEPAADSGPVTGSHD